MFSCLGQHNITLVQNKEHSIQVVGGRTNQRNGKCYVYNLPEAVRRSGPMYDPRCYYQMDAVLLAKISVAN